MSVLRVYRYYRTPFSFRFELCLLYFPCIHMVIATNILSKKMMKYLGQMMIARHNVMWRNIRRSYLPEVESNTSSRSSPFPRIDEWLAPQLKYMLLENLASTKPLSNATAVTNSATNRARKLSIATPRDTLLLSKISNRWSWSGIHWSRCVMALYSLWSLNTPH